MNALKMNPEIRAKWAAALRSGEFPQGDGYLHYEDTFCCLGVLCELAVKAGALPPPEPDPADADIWLYGNNNGLLPEAVQQWAGLSKMSPTVFVTVESEPGEPQAWELAHLNDQEGWTFAQIADAIDGGTA